MKILVFTDVHANERSFKKLKDKAKACDFAICCGDFTLFGSKQRKILAKMSSFNLPIYLIHGNHENKSEVQADCKYINNIHFIHGTSIRLNYLNKVGESITIQLIGHGGGGFSHIDERFKKLESKYSNYLNSSLLENQSSNKLINMLILHGPPLGFKLDYLDGVHVGCSNTSNFIKKHSSKLDYVFCGHIHENNYKRDNFNKTKLINPGPNGLIITI